MSSNKDNEKIYGPVMPSQFRQNSKETSSESESDNENGKADKICGPMIPATSKKKSSDDEKNSCSQGPIIPTHATENKESNDYFGPMLPPHLLKKKQLEEKKESTSEEEDTDNIVGPILSKDGMISSKKELEERALQIKIKGIDEACSSKDDKDVREEWMTELPGLNKSGLSIFARQFRKREGPDMTDRSIWTDTPNTVKKPKESSKKHDKSFDKTKYDEEKDKEQEKMIKKHKKKHKREKSLMELHEKKLKKEKKKKEKEKNKEKSTILDRRPFNREEDLQVNRFDLSRKQALIKKASQLDDKFSSGKSKYL